MVSGDIGEAIHMNTAIANKVKNLVGEAEFSFPHRNIKVPKKSCNGYHEKQKNKE